MASNIHGIRPHRVLLNKVTWHPDYGTRDSDALPVGEGALVATNPGDLGEFQNFQAHEGGWCFGLVRRPSLAVERLGAPPGASSQFGVLVVSVAPLPDEKNKVVVGWQTGCDVFRKRQSMGPIAYNYRCRPEATHLLAVEERVYPIPSGTGGVGQTMIAYGLDTNGSPHPWLDGLVQWIAERTPGTEFL